MGSPGAVLWRLLRRGRRGLHWPGMGRAHRRRVIPTGRRPDVIQPWRSHGHLAARRRSLAGRGTSAAAARNPAEGAVLIRSQRHHRRARPPMSRLNAPRRRSRTCSAGPLIFGCQALSSARRWPVTTSNVPTVHLRLADLLSHDGAKPVHLAAFATAAALGSHPRRRDHRHHQPAPSSLAPPPITLLGGTATWGGRRRAAVGVAPIATGQQ